MGFGGPLEGLRFAVALSEPGLDGSLEFGNALEYAAADLLAGDFGEQPFDEVDPRRRCWREVHLEARMFGEPGLHFLGLVGLVIVADRMHVEVVGYRPVDLFQEADELLGAVTRQALAGDPARLHLEWREKSRRAIALVVVRHRLSPALLHRQARLGAIERLNLAFLVDAEHDCLVGRIEVEPDNVDYFLSEFWIVGELEWARQMWFEALLLLRAFQ